MKTIGNWAVLGVLALGLVFAAGKVLEPGIAHAQQAGTAFTHVPDAGTAYVATVSAKQYVVMQCREPSCIRLIAGAKVGVDVTASCTTDMQIAGATASGSTVIGDKAGVIRGERVKIETGGLGKIIAVAADGGDPGCVWQNEVKNP